MIIRVLIVVGNNSRPDSPSKSEFDIPTRPFRILPTFEPFLFRHTMLELTSAEFSTVFHLQIQLAPLAIFRRHCCRSALRESSVLSTYLEWALLYVLASCRKFESGNVIFNTNNGEMEYSSSICVWFFVLLVLCGIYGADGNCLLCKRF